MSRRATLPVVLISLASLVLFCGASQEVRVTNFPDPQNVAGTVEISNLPTVQDVNVTTPVEVIGAVAVTNLPAPAGTSRFQLVGFSSTTVPGIGFFTMTLACQQDFPDSRPDVYERGSDGNGAGAELACGYRGLGSSRPQADRHAPHVQWGGAQGTCSRRVGRGGRCF